jgi:hypothetical protein
MIVGTTVASRCQAEVTRKPGMSETSIAAGADHERTKCGGGINEKRAAMSQLTVV